MIFDQNLHQNLIFDLDFKVFDQIERINIFSNWKNLTNHMKTARLHRWEIPKHTFLEKERCDERTFNKNSVSKFFPCS